MDPELTPQRVTVNGRPFWDFGHRLLPVISGGEGPLSTGEGSNGDGGTDTGNGDGGDQGGQDTGQETETTSLDPAAMARELEQARREAARYRTERNGDRERATQLESQIQQINKALGLEQDEPDADALQARLSERDSEVEDLRSEIHTLRIERAFSAAARANDADEELTLAVLLRQNTLSGLDPEADDFTTRLNDAVKAAVTANPKLRATQVAAKSGSAFNGQSTTRSDGPVDLAGAIASALS